MTRARTLADMISDGVIGTTELADDAITPVKLDETGSYAMAGLTVDTNTLHVDSANNRVGIGTTSPASQAHIYNAAASANLRIETDADAYASISFLNDQSNWGAGVDTANHFYVYDSINSSNVMEFGNNDIVFNQTGKDYDFRVESSGNANMIYVDADQNRVSIGSSSGYQQLNVNGNIAVGGAGNKGIYFGDNMTSSADQEWLLANNASDSNSLNLYEYEGGIYQQTRMKFVSGGDMYINGHNNASIVMNEFSTNTDFRVESDGNAHMLFVDAGNNTVGIGNSSPTEAGLVVDSIGTDVNTSARLALKSNETSVDTYLRFGRFGTGVDPSMTITNNYYRTSSGYVADDTSYGVTSMFFGDGEISFGSNQAGTASPLQRMVIKQSEVVVNEQGYDNDFRVESDGASHMLFVDAANGTLGINNSSPEVIADIGRNSTTGFSNTADQRSQMALTIRNGSEASGRFVGMNLIAGGGAQSDWSINNVWQSNYVGKLAFKTRTGANSTDWRQIFAMTAGNEVVFNEDSTDIDFRVESDANSNAFKVDAAENSGQGAVLVGTGSMFATGNSDYIAHTMTQAASTTPMLVNGAMFAMPDIPSGKQAQAGRWKFGGFKHHWYPSAGTRVDSSFSQLVVEISGGVSGKTDMELFELGFNRGWESRPVIVEVYERGYINGGYKKYFFHGGYDPSFTLYENYGNNSISLNVLAEGPFQKGTSSVSSSTVDQSYYRKTVRATLSAYYSGHVVVTIPSYMKITNNAEVDTSGLMRLLNPQ